MSFKVEFFAEGAWTSNNIRFVTRLEAEAYALVFTSETPVWKFRILHTPDPVYYPRGDDDGREDDDA